MEVRHHRARARRTVCRTAAGRLAACRPVRSPSP
jgi:hypothetical protein